MRGGADDGETEAEAEDDDEAPAETDGEPENDDPKKKKKSGNPKTDDGTAEISKIESTNHKAFIEMWSQIEEAVSGGAKPAPAEKIDDKESPKGKEFIAKHKIDKKEVEDLQGVEKPKEVKLKKEASEFEVIRALLSGKLQQYCLTQKNLTQVGFFYAQ